MAASSLGQGEITMEDVGRRSRQEHQITGEGQGEIAIAMEDVGQSSRQDDQITGQGSHENNAGGTQSGGTRRDPINPVLYRYATMSKSGVIIPRDVVTLVERSENEVSTCGNTVLHLAANTGHVQLIQLINEKFPGLVRKTNDDGELPLHVAASAGHLSAVRKLVERTEGGDTFKERDNRGNTALHFAVENNHHDVAMYLVGKDGSTSHSTNNSSKTPLCMAAETANLELVKKMVDNTPDGTDSDNFWQGLNGYSILRSAIIRKKQAKGGLNKYDAVFVLVTFLLCFMGTSILVVAGVVSWSRVSRWRLPSTNRMKYKSMPLSFLFSEGLLFALVMPMLIYDKDPLFLAVGVVCWTYFKRIVSKWWLPITNRKKYTRMHLSLLFSEAVFEVVMPILIVFSPTPFTLTGVACWIIFKGIVSQWWLPRTNRKKYTNLLEMILKNMDSADLQKSMDQGLMSPLTLAAYMDNFVAVRILLKEFTELAYKGDENKLLPIHVASKKGHCRVVQEFLNRHPDLRESRDREGRNILHVAAAHGRVDVVRYIIGKRDLQVLSKQRDQSGNTPLHIAVQNWHPKTVKILSLFRAYERANLNSLNNEGMTALDLAEKTGVDKKMLFRRKLTLMALNLADAPRSEEQTAALETEDSVPKSLHTAALETEDSVPKSLHTAALETEDSVPKSLHYSDNLMFSKESVNTLLLVSTLVVGITFVQGFTIPGGYSSSGIDVGRPVFLTHRLFQIFLICNTVAMCGSITASIALIWAQTYDPNIIFAAMRFTLPVLGVTLTMMSSSFLAGVALTVHHVLWLRIFVYAMGLSFTVFIVGLLAPLIDVPVSYKTIPTRAILLFCFNLLMFVGGYN